MKTRIAMITAALIGLLLSGTAFAGDDDDDRHERRSRHHERHDRHEERHQHRHRHHHKHTHSEVVYAPVIYVEPIYRVVHRARPRQECWSTTETYGGHGNGAAGLVLGGVLGGVIGQNLSHGHHNDTAVLAGTLLGATIGHDMGHSGSRPVTRTHCETRDDFDEVEEIVSYRVKYRHIGRIYETRTERHPGTRIQVTVNIDD